MKTRTDRGLLDPEFIARLERLSVAAKKARAGRTKGERRSRKRGSSLEFADYRDYAQGDDLRRVDWNAYARLDSLYLKLFEDQEDLTLHLLIDASASMGFGDPTKLDFARRLAAAIGYVGLAGHDRVTAFSIQGGRSEYMPPAMGKRNAARLFAFLESIKDGGAGGLEEGCRSHVARTGGRGVTVLISDVLEEGEGREAIKWLARPDADVHLIHVLAPEEIEPGISGDLKLIDCETGDATEVSASRGLLKTYARRLEEFRRSVRARCMARGVGYHFVSSGDSVESLTLGVLRKSGAIK